MLMQSLVVIAAMLVLTGSILLETLLTARSSLHQAMAARTQTAMTDATASFVQWAQQQVATYGAGNAAAWPAQSAPLQDNNICPVASATTGSTPPPCTFAAFDTWQIRGSTNGSSATTNGTPVPGIADAQNLAPTVNEQRLAATITVRITDPTGRRTYADRTRDATARIFEAPPYVVVTGERDVTAEVGSIHADEGDTGGAAQPGGLSRQNYSSPNPYFPADDTDTRIITSIDCLNRTGFDENEAAQTAVSGAVDYSFHPYGNRDWAFEVACDPPGGSPSPPPGIQGYIQPTGSLYQTSPSDMSNRWVPGTTSNSPFAR
jgi:hypothetical protein